MSLPQFGRLQTDLKGRLGSYRECVNVALFLVQTGYVDVQVLGEGA